jgi:uncharacterized protein (DUF1501 family)
MLTRRALLTSSLKASSLLAFGSLVPEFIVNTALAADAGKDNILVVIEMNGGNDGLNTVIPYTDDLYQKARKTLRLTKEQVVKVNDTIGLNPGMNSFGRMLNNLAIVQGIGYPNPDRSHFESMDIWHQADPGRKQSSGWLGRASADLQNGPNIPIMNIGQPRLPLALQGPGGGAISINNRQPYRLDLGGGTAERHKARRTLLNDLANPAKDEDLPAMLQFVQRRQVQTLSTIDRLQEVLRNYRSNDFFFNRNGQQVDAGKSLQPKLNMIAHLIQQGFGTRVFYVMRDDFDTHSDQVNSHRNLLAEVSDGIVNFFDQLRGAGHDKRVRVMTFSEFGRRVQENGSKGTDHGAGSCMFVAGPSVKGGVVGDHPSLKDLDSGDLKYHTDFRRVYATLLDTWLGCDSKTVLGGNWEHIEALKPVKA